MDQMETSVSLQRGRRFIGMRLRPRSRIWIAVVAGFMLWPQPTLAVSNLQQAYPAHQCGEKPVQPERPEKFQDRAELDAYNAKVEAYNADMEQYVGCLQSYVDNAAADIRAIRDKIDAALKAVEP